MEKGGEERKGREKRMGGARRSQRQKGRERAWLGVGEGASGERERHGVMRGRARAPVSLFWRRGAGGKAGAAKCGARLTAGQGRAIEAAASQADPEPRRLRSATGSGRGAR